jgi:hypothetical protein
MGILAWKADERVARVSFTPESLSVSLMDGRSLCLWPGIRSFSTRHPNNCGTGGLLAEDTAFIGPTSMRI